MKKSILVIIIASIICLPVYSATKDNTQKREVDEKGYMGTLPDITDKYDKSRTSISTPVFEAQEGFTDPNELKPIPTENPAFINVILKKDKTSKYLNDLNEVIPMLEKVLTSIENEDNVQVFMSKALTLGLNVNQKVITSHLDD